MKLTNKLLAAFLAFTVVFPTSSFAATTSKVEPTDVTKHWAENQITDWLSKGWVKGYEDGSFKPDASIKRSELVALTNRAFGFVSSEEVNYKDVKSTDWFYGEVAQAQKAGYISGYTDGTFMPEKNITRQEMAVVVSKLLSLESSQSAEKYSDTANSPEWSKGAIGAVIDKGIMQGNGGDQFAPGKMLTRAEAVVILDRALKQKVVAYDIAGTYGPQNGIEKISSDVAINVSGVTLQNLDITGNLLIGKGVGEGEVFLKNVTVHGTTTVIGGGEHSIHFENTALVSVIVDKVGGNVRIVVSGSNSSVQEVTVQSNARIESEGGGTIKDVTLASTLPQDSKVQLVGSFETVNVLAKSIMVQIPQGRIANLNVDSNAGSTTVDISREASIVSLVLNAVSSIIGSGTVESATINATGITMETAPKTTVVGQDVAKDVTVLVGGTAKPVGAAPAFTSAPVVSGGGSTGGGETATPTPTPSPTSTPTPAIDTTPPVIVDYTQNKVVWGDVINVTVSEKSKVYFVLMGYLLDDALDAGVQDGGKLIEVEANVPSEIHTNSDGLVAGNYALVAIDEAGNVSEFKQVTLTDTLDKDLKVMFTISGSVNNVSAVLNKYIHAADESTLKASVTVSTYEGEPFHALAEGDTVNIPGDKLTLNIKFAEGIYGNQTRIKVAAGALLDDSNNPNKEVIIIGDIYSELTKTILISNDNGTLSIKSNKPSVVYLVEQSIPIEQVQEFGLLIEVAIADTPVLLPTQGLPAGTYKLITINGNVINDIVLN